MYHSFLLLFVTFTSVVSLDECNLNACDAIRKVKDDIDIDDVKSHLINLERRLRSLEQPGKSFYFICYTLDSFLKTCQAVGHKLMMNNLRINVKKIRKVKRNKFVTCDKNHKKTSHRKQRNVKG